MWLVCLTSSFTFPVIWSPRVGVRRAKAVFKHAGSSFVSAFAEYTPARDIAEQVVVVATDPGRVPAVGRFKFE